MSEAVTGDLRTELSFARGIAALGGRIAMAHYRKDPQARRKLDGTWVTEADWAVEAQIRLRIARVFPEHNVLGEEEGLTRAGGGEALPGAPTWVIDPIDGTNNYIAGIPIWATLVGLQIDDRPVVGVCHAPALGETYSAALGEGADMNGEAIRVDPVGRLEDATVLYAGAEGFSAPDLHGFFHSLVDGARRTRGLGDFWGHMLVARGAAHVMVEPALRAWDVVPLVPIIEEAGGRLTHLDGSVWRDKGSCLTSCGTLHERVVELAVRSEAEASS